MITRASARKGFSLLELIVVLVVLGLLAAIAIPTYQALIGKTQDKTVIATAESVARNAIALAAFDRESPVTDGTPDALNRTYLADAAAEVEGETVAIAVTADEGAGDDGEVCVNISNVGADDKHVAVVFQEGLNAAFEVGAVTSGVLPANLPCP